MDNVTIPQVLEGRQPVSLKERKDADLIVPRNPGC
jgi:hypothetical protein